ncbi:MAG: hypothetical protein J6S67_20430 [Methanobrevibacter sp.]|nr:hypothetical protein [Methanobrevibacter sp.]
MAIFNANLEVTKATVQGGEIKDLEINRQNVPLASSVKIEAEKDVTIDASTYSSPVEVTPTAGKNAMAKVVVTLTNVSAIPTFFAWGMNSTPAYFSISENLSAGDIVHTIADDTQTISSDTAVISSVGTDDTGPYIAIENGMGQEFKYYRKSSFDWTWSE